MWRLCIGLILWVSMVTCCIASDNDPTHYTRDDERSACRVGKEIVEKYFAPKGEYSLSNYLAMVQRDYRDIPYRENSRVQLNACLNSVIANCRKLKSSEASDPDFNKLAYTFDDARRILTELRSVFVLEEASKYLVTPIIGTNLSRLDQNSPQDQETLNMLLNNAIGKFQKLKQLTFEEVCHKQTEQFRNVCKQFRRKDLSQEKMKSEFEQLTQTANKLGQNIWQNTNDPDLHKHFLERVSNFSIWQASKKLGIDVEVLYLGEFKPEQYLQEFHKYIAKLLQESL